MNTFSTCRFHKTASESHPALLKANTLGFVMRYDTTLQSTRNISRRSLKIEHLEFTKLRLHHLTRNTIQIKEYMFCLNITCGLVVSLKLIYCIFFVKCT